MCLLFKNPVLKTQIKHRFLTSEDTVVQAWGEARNLKHVIKVLSPVVAGTGQHVIRPLEEIIVGFVFYIKV